LEQMTIVRPFRRITRHRSHIGLTDARTFTNHLVRTAPRERGEWTRKHAQPGCAQRAYGSKTVSAA
jgi:hypothetical protein